MVFIFYIYVIIIIITYNYSEWILILFDIVWYLSECSECLSPLLSLLNVSSFESRPCDGPFNETRACAHAGRKEIQTVQYDPRVSRCLKEIIWWLPMIVYDLWAVRRQVLGLTMHSSSEFDVVRQWYSIASDFQLAKLHTMMCVVEESPNVIRKSIASILIVSEEICCEL